MGGLFYDIRRDVRPAPHGNQGGTLLGQIKSISRVHAISKMVSYRLFHETTLALGPYEPPEKVLDPPAFARLPARPLKFGPLCTGG